MAKPPSISDKTNTPIPLAPLQIPSKAHTSEPGPTSPSHLPVASPLDGLPRRPTTPGSPGATSLSGRVSGLFSRSRAGSNVSSQGGLPTITALARQGVVMAGPAAASAATVASKNFFNPTRLAKIRISGATKTGSINYYTGKVEKRADKKLEADEFLVDGFLQFAQTPTASSPQVLGEIDLRGGEASLTFSMDPRIIQLHADFDKRCMVSDIETRIHSTSEKMKPLGGDPVSILIPMLLRVMTEGRSAFKPNAKMEIPGHEEQHPYDYLVEMMPQISSDNPTLAAGLQRVLLDRADYRARVAAAQVLAIASEKTTAVDGWAASVGLAILTETPWVVALLPAFILFLTRAGLSPAKAAASIAGLNMIPSTVIEIVDAFIGFLILLKLKKKDASFRELAPKALLAGVVSGMTSFPYNLLQESGGIPDGAYPVLRDIGNVVLNTAAAGTQIVGAGLGLPMESQAGRLNLTAAMTHDARDPNGLMSVPAHLKTDKEVEDFFDDLSAKATHYNPSDGAAEASVSMMMGAAMMSVALDGRAIISHGAERLLSQRVMNIIDILVFQPIEAHTLHAVWLASKINIPLVKNSEEKEYKLLVVALTNAEISGVPFTRADLDKINPELLKRLGSSISSMVMSVIDLPPTIIDAVRGIDTSLSGSIKYPKPIPPVDPNAPAKQVSLPQIQINDPEDAV